MTNGVTTTTTTHTETPFSFEERLLVTTPSSKLDRQQQENAESAETTMNTVRLESLAQWKENTWVHPFQDIDLNLPCASTDCALRPTNASETSSQQYYRGRIERIHMAVSSHGRTNEFPTAKGLDLVPLLPRWDGTNQFIGGIPKGFFLSIMPKSGLSVEEEAKAVQSVFEELIRRRILTTPVTGGEWDVLPLSSSSSISHLYQLVMPFENAAWSGDALAQSFRRSLPAVCATEKFGREPDTSINENNQSFFGWSAMEWSNFLVGYRGSGGRNLETGNVLSRQYPTFNKMMWWTWTFGSNVPSSQTQERAFSFGIQYQTAVPLVGMKDWLPRNFLDKISQCPIGNRTFFQVVPVSNAGDYNLMPLEREPNMTEKIEENPPSLKSSRNFPYSINIDQVLRRHNTNYGRLESSIDLKALIDDTEEASIDDGGEPCRMTYRQVIPDFLDPMWRSLKIETPLFNEDEVGSDTARLHGSVEWNQDSKKSVLIVEAKTNPIHVGNESTPSTQLPSKIFISLEYAPSFLTIDDFPGDPNRGRVFPPATVTVQCEPSIATEATKPLQTVVYSNALLLLPPVPDLSMPFNVIAFTSSLYAYIIGIIVTILVRKASENIKYNYAPQSKPESKFSRAKKKIKEKLGKAKGKLLGFRTN